MHGGVSVIETVKPVKVASFPYTWGCFHGQCHRTMCRLLFPICMGVFPRIPSSTSVQHFSSPDTWGLKLWFVQVQPNVFVSGIKDFLASELADFVFDNATAESGLILFRSTKKAPGYDIVTKGTCGNKVVDINGMKLIQSVASDS
jgi:CRISPR-associated endoribonuclease Cas2 subtype I-E